MAKAKDQWVEVPAGWDEEKLLNILFSEAEQELINQLGITFTTSHVRANSFGYWRRQREPRDLAQINFRFYDDKYRAVRTFTRPRKSDQKLNRSKIRKNVFELIEHAKAAKRRAKERDELRTTQQRTRASVREELGANGFRESFDLKINPNGKISFTLDFDSVEEMIETLAKIGITKN